jgi:hypothetical protein
MWRNVQANVIIKRITKIITKKPADINGFRVQKAEGFETFDRLPEAQM